MNRLVDAQRRPGVTIAHCRGELDLATVPALRAGLDAALARTPSRGADPGPNGGAVVLDLAGVEFLDCAGLRVLVTVAERCDRDGRALVVCGVTGVVRRLFETLELGRVFVQTADLEVAVALAESWQELGDAPTALARGGPPHPPADVRRTGPPPPPPGQRSRRSRTGQQPWWRVWTS